VALLLVAAFAARGKRRMSIVVRRHLPPYATMGLSFTYRLSVHNAGAILLQPARFREELAEALPSLARFRRAAIDAEAGSNWVDRRIGFPRWLALVRHLRGGDIE